MYSVNSSGRRRAYRAGGGGETTAASDERIEVFGDASCGTVDVVGTLEQAGIEPNVKVQPPSAREGIYSQDAFTIDVAANTVRCPAGQLVALRRSKDGAGHASFGASYNDLADVRRTLWARRDPRNPGNAV